MSTEIRTRAVPSGLSTCYARRKKELVGNSAGRGTEAGDGRRSKVGRAGTDGPANPERTNKILAIG